MYSKTYLIINRNMLLTCHVMIYYIFVELLLFFIINRSCLSVDLDPLLFCQQTNHRQPGSFFMWYTNTKTIVYTCKIGIQIYLNTKTECSESGTSLIHHLGSWWSLDREVEGTPLLHLFCHKAFLHCFNATWLHCIATLLIRIIVCSNNEALNHAACTHNG